MGTNSLGVKFKGHTHKKSAYNWGNVKNVKSFLGLEPPPPPKSA